MGKQNHTKNKPRRYCVLVFQAIRMIEIAPYQRFTSTLYLNHSSWKYFCPAHWKSGVLLAGEVSNTQNEFLSLCEHLTNTLFIYLFSLSVNTFIWAPITELSGIFLWVLLGSLFIPVSTHKFVLHLYPLNLIDFYFVCLCDRVNVQFMQTVCVCLAFSFRCSAVVIM